MRMVLRIVLLMGAAVLTGACAADPSTGDERTAVATAWPAAELARQILGEGFEVIDISPPGVEPHDLELTAKDLQTIADAEVVIHLGDGFQPALASALPEDRSINLLDLAGASGEDPHIWLDPVLWSQVSTDLGEQLADALDSEDLSERGQQVAADISAVHGAFAEGLGDCERDVLLTEHEAYGYLLDRYNLRGFSLTGLVPEAEVTADALDELRDIARKEGATTVFAEPGSEDHLADTLASEAGLEVRELDPLEIGGGSDSYGERMLANLTSIQEALGCR